MPGVSVEKSSEAEIAETTLRWRRIDTPLLEAIPIAVADAGIAHCLPKEGIV
jgi:hypothetical protein